VLAMECLRMREGYGIRNAVNSTMKQEQKGNIRASMLFNYDQVTDYCTQAN